MKKRLALSLVTLVGIGVLLGSTARDARSQDGSGEPAFCQEMTPARLLQDPQVARELYGAMDRGEFSARQRFHAMIGEMRAVHGCEALQESEVGAGAMVPSPRLPPGHPPIERAPRAPMFADDSKTLSI
jgi:hypothetical protein